MNLIAFFTENGTPKTGLTPTIDVVDTDGNVKVNAQSMTEISLGFYKYDFTAYDETLDYCMSADGGVTLANNDRYVFATNETAGVANILKISKNKWEMKANQLIIYDDDGTTALYTFDLKNQSGGESMENVFSRAPV